MSREIKFRAWIHGSFRYITNNYDLKFWSSDGGHGPESSLGDMGWQQWTGLVDKAGKDIYEGDVIRWVTTFNTTSKTVHTDAVTWCENVVCFLLMPHCHELNGADMEIIGNIYENPDLLQTETEGDA